MAKHAFLSASSAHRWLECPPSAKACEGVDERASPYAQQGTDCHELCAYLVEKDDLILIPQNSKRFSDSEKSTNPAV